MKLFFKITLALSLITAVAIADEMLSLKDNMKQTSALLKQITNSVNDSSKNQINAANAGKMITLFTAARNQTPDVGSLDEYKNLIDQEITLFTQLQSALTNNDTASAQAFIQKINQIKKEGHDKFN